MSSRLDQDESAVSEPQAGEIFSAVGLGLVMVAITRIPFARTGPVESDEFTFIDQMNSTWFPAHHTLFQAAGRAIGMVVGGQYRGLVALDILVSALALASLWWWLRALVRPSTAAGVVVVVGVSPLFWSLGEMAGNYTMIPLVGAFLLGVAYRGWRAPRWWHPYASAAVLAVGTGYRQDIGTFMLPLLGVIVWRHRWRGAVGALALFTILNLAWLLPMLHAVGGWEAFRRQSAEFAYAAGYRNSIWNLGFVDAPVRYAVKIGVALLCTVGPGLLLVPQGFRRLIGLPDGKKLAGLLALGMAPALGSHLLVHFGVAGYSFHYLPAVVALLALGVAGTGTDPAQAPWYRRANLRLGGLAGLMAAVFLFYPANIHQGGWRGDFDLVAGRYTRSGLKADLSSRTSTTWRTSNSVKPAGYRAK